MFLLKTEGSGKEEGKLLLQLEGCAGSSAAGLWALSLPLNKKPKKNPNSEQNFPFSDEHYAPAFALGLNTADKSI